jgi:hypothetical protein
MEYTEPELTVLVLDFRKERETRRCLESVKKHLKVSHKIIYLHNGVGVDYPYELFREGLIDQFIQTKKNNGLDVGTRDLFAASFSPWSFYLQNDQTLKRDFTQEEFDQIKNMIGQQLQSPEDGSVWTVKSVDLAGGMAGLHTYSERAHIVPTAFYKKLEEAGLNYGGAGPYHHVRWREGQIQDFYKTQHFLHYTYPNVLVNDDGDTSIRENPDGSIWEHHADTNGVRLVRGPIKEKNDHPPFTDLEWEQVLKTQSWPEWQVPERRKRS